MGSLRDQNLRGPGCVLGVRIGDEAQRKGVEVDLRSKDCCLVVG